MQSAYVDNFFAAWYNAVKRKRKLKEGHTWIL